MRYVATVLFLLMASSPVLAAQQTILSGTGVYWDTEKTKINENFTELYAWLWNSSDTYATGEFVFYDQYVWKALQAVPAATTPVEGAYWTADLGTGGGGVGTDDQTAAEVPFADSEGNWTATEVESAFAEMDNEINSGIPNSATAKVHWSQLTGVPSGFADGLDAGATGGSAIIFDIDDNGTHQSEDVVEIATEGDTNNIFTEPTDDKIHIDVSQNWPTADNATLAVTATTANAGDSATAFFSSGEIEDARIPTAIARDSELPTQSTLSIDDLISLTGQVEGTTTHPSFTGTTIPDSSTTSDALQALETAVEASTGGNVRDDTTESIAAVWTWGDGIELEFGTGNDWGIFYDEATDNRLEFVHTAGADADVFWDLNDSAADSTFTITNSSATYVADLVVEGDIQASTMSLNSVDNPYWIFDDDDSSPDWVVGTYDTTNDRLEFRQSVTVDTDVVMYLDLNELNLDADLDITTGHNILFNGTQIALSNISDGESHATNHTGATDQIDGDQLDIDWSPTTYTPAATPSEAADVDDLTAHLYGIDQYLSGIAGGTLESLPDVIGATAPADMDYGAGYLIVGDGVNSFDEKNPSGDVDLASDGTFTIQADAVEDTMVDWGTMTYLGEEGQATAASVGLASTNLDDSDASIEWEDATALDSGGALDVNTVDSDQYVDGSIDNIHLADDAVNSDELATSAVDSNHLASISESTVLAEPDQLQPISDAWMIKYFPAETYPSGVVIDAIHITTSATCTDALNFEEWTQSGTASSSTVEAITLSGTFTEDDGTLADNAIAADGRLMVDLPASPSDIAFYEITVVYHAN